MSEVNEMMVVTDPREYIRFWFSTNNYTARMAFREADMMSTINLDYGRFHAAFRARNPHNKAPKLRRDDLDDAYTEYVKFHLKQEMQTALKAFACEKENLKPLQAWVKAVTGKEDIKDVSVMAHWIWLVKRNGFNKAIKHQIMPVLYGPQGGGKTIALMGLIKPIEDFRLTIGMNQLADERVFEGLANHFVALFDELQGVERTDMNALKKQITTTFNSYRKLYSHSVVNIPMRCSFIGATNRPINESFNDSTGMRRFWQIDALPKLDWQVISGIDYVELYKGVNENSDEGYLTGEQLHAVLAEQQKYVNKDNVEEFIIDSALLPEAGSQTYINLDELYAAYVHWSGAAGLYKRVDRNWFARKMQGRLEFKKVKAAKGQEKKVYIISKDAEIVPGPGTEKLLKEGKLNEQKTIN